MDPSPSAAAPDVANGIAPEANKDANAHGGLMSHLLALRVRGVPVLTLFLLGFALWVTVGNYLPTRADTASTAQALDQQRLENRELAERIRCAEAHAERLAKDPWLHERILRDQLHMTRAGEVIVR